MPFTIFNDVITDPRGKTYNVFNQHSKQDRLKKQYKNLLQKQVNKFLRTADDDVDKHDVARYLEKQGMINDRITSSENYKDIVKKALDNKPVSLGGAKTKKKRNRTSRNAPDTTSGKALTYLENHIRPKLSVHKHGNKINEDDIIKPLTDNNIVKNKAELTKQFIQRMKAVIFRHNAEIYKKEFNKYQQGKNTYQMTVESIVWDEQQQRIRTDTQNIDFKSDLDKDEITQDMVLDITFNYYATKDYPDFIELNKRKVIKLNGGTNIRDIKLYNFGENKRYVNPYIKQPHEYIKDWNKLAENEYNRECVRFLLRTQFYKLVERHLIPKQILSDDHFDRFFNNEYTINKTIEFVKTQLNNYGTIYIYDPSGQILIDKYIGYKQEATATIDNNITNTSISRRYCKTVIGIINGDHIDAITEPNVSNSISHGMPLCNIFSTPLRNEAMTFEIFDNPEQIACCNENHIEYNDDGTEKNKNVDVILFEENEHECNQTITKYGVLSYKDDGTMIINDNVGEIIEINPKCKILCYKNNGFVIDDGDNTIEIVYQYKSNKSNKNDAVLIETVESIETLKFDVKIEIKQNIINKPFTFQNNDGKITIEIKMPPCKDVKELYYKTSKHHNVVITNPIFDGTAMIGFKHPLTNQQFIKTSDFYERQKICNTMYQEKGFNDLAFKNQSWFQISVLLFEHYNLGSWNGILSHLSENQRDLYLQHPISQCIGRHDDDEHLKDTLQKSGTNNKFTFDIVKSFSSVLLNRTDDWIVPTQYDVFEEFDINNPQHVKIPYGEYILHTGSYGNPRTQLKFNANYYSFSTINKFLRYGYIQLKHIKSIRMVKKRLPNNYFRLFVETAYNKFGKSGKKIINTFVGGLHQITYKRRFGNYTDKQEVAIALTNEYTKHGLKSHLEPDLYEELYFITAMSETPNYHTGTAIWRQIQEDAIWQLHNVIELALYKTPKAEVIAYNTDSATILNPNSKYLKKAIENTQNKDDFNMIGDVKLEDTIKCKGHPFEYVNETREDVVLKQINPIQIYREKYPYEAYNTDFLEDVRKLNSCLINAGGAGYGKSVLLLMLFDNDNDVIIVPQHANKKSLLADAKIFNIKIEDKRIHVMADFFNDELSFNEQINSFKFYKKILIDEIYQCNQEDIYKLHLVRLRFNTIIIGSGDPLQIPTPNPNNDSYDLTNNKFFTDELFDGKRVILDYLKECGRFQDDTPSLLKMICETHQLPDIFISKKADINHNRHLTLTKTKRDTINKICSLRYCKNKSDGGMLNPDDTRIIDENNYSYGVGMLIVSNGNKNMYHKDNKGNDKTYVMKNKLVYEIIYIYKDSHEFDIRCLNTNTLIQDVPLYKIQNFFIPYFASTIDSVQGSRITEPFSIWELDNKHFNLNRLNSAIGRTINKDLVHLDLKHKDKYFEWHKYEDHIIINPMSNNDDHLYDTTWHYEIRENGKVIYVGLTTRTIHERLNEHWKTAKTNPRDNFHKYLINCNENEITITTNDYPEPLKHRNKADAEKFENQHIKSYFVDCKNTLLNTKTELKAFKGREPIKLTNTDKEDILTLDKLNQLKNSSLITPTIYDDKKNQQLKIYFRIDGVRIDKKVRYKKRGLEEAMNEVYKIIQKEQEMFQQRITGNVNYK